MSMNKKKFISICLFILISVVLINIVSSNVFAETTTQAARNYVGENFCSETSVKRLLLIAGYILIVAKILIPLIIIGVGTSDLYKTIVSSDAGKDLGKQVRILGLRVAIGVFIFFVPNIVNWTIGLLSNNSSNSQCISCFLEPTSCSVDTNR